MRCCRPTLLARSCGCCHVRQWAPCPGPGRSASFASLRAWASAAEGARLVDWLRLEAPTARVLAALLTENRGNVVSPASYQRLRDAIAKQPDAFFAARAARLRARTAKPPAVRESISGELALWHLTLQACACSPLGRRYPGSFRGGTRDSLIRGLASAALECRWLAPRRYGAQPWTVCARLSNGAGG